MLLLIGMEVLDLVVWLVVTRFAMGLVLRLNGIKTNENRSQLNSIIYRRIVFSLGILLKFVIDVALNIVPISLPFFGEFLHEMLI